MSLIFRRGLSNLVPPKISSPSGVSAAPDAKRIQRLIRFYERLPRGPAPDPPTTGPISWYRNKYFGKKDSAAPLAHLIGFFLVFGYSQEYYFHLKYHHAFCPYLAEDSQ
ncbi:MAG: hypothetical protein M1831_002729 [Alyxoria varia]|nr:MAG: hypothetical protein M1831_002729 [Alyxoria varia]